MVHIRLSRKGKKKQPIYRVIVCDKQKDPFGTYLENLGFYNPRTKELKLDADRVKYWLGQGAQPSDTIWNLLLEKGLVEGKKRSSSSISQTRQTKLADSKKKEAEEQAAKAQAVAEAEKAAAQPVEQPADQPTVEQPVDQPTVEQPVDQPTAEQPVDQPTEPTPVA